MLGNEEEMVQQARMRSTVIRPALPGAAIAASADPHDQYRSGSSSSGSSTGATGGALIPLEHFGGARSGRALVLPETTLSGPLELVLPAPEPVSVFTPHAADVGAVRRVVVEAGATVRVGGMRRLTLRRPVELPRLPGQYLAEVYATAKLGQPEEGFNFAPGILYMASQLRKQALSLANSSSESRAKKAARPPSPLLSFDVEPVTHGSLTIVSAHEAPSSDQGPAPRLKVRKLAGGAVELSVRLGQVAPERPFDPAALSRVWAWPLPALDMASWLPYESLLRSVLAAHPFNPDSVARRGIGLRLTKSTIQGVHMVSFDMAVRSRAPRPAELDPAFEWNETPLEIWEAVVQVQPQAAAGSSGSAGAGSSSAGSSSSSGAYSFVPLHVRRKAAFQNTLSVSRSAVLAALAGGRNATALERIPGYDQEEVGLAAYAP